METTNLPASVTELKCEAIVERAWNFNLRRVQVRKKKCTCLARFTHEGKRFCKKHLNARLAVQAAVSQLEEMLSHRLQWLLNLNDKKIIAEIKVLAEDLEPFVEKSKLRRRNEDKDPRN